MNQDLPDGWVWSSCGEIAAPERNAIMDGPFGSKLKTEHYRESGARVVRLGNIQPGRFVDEDRAYISLTYFKELVAHEVRPGDLLIAALGDPLGRTCRAPDNLGPAIVKADCLRYRPASTVNADYLVYWLNSPEGRECIETLSHGVGRKRINTSDLRRVAFPRAPVREQLDIALKLDKLFSYSNAARGELDRISRLIERYKQAVLTAAFRGDVMRQRRPDNVTLSTPQEIRQSIFCNREKLRKANGVRSKGANRSISAGTGSLPELPEGWIWTTFDECSWDLTVGHVGPMKSRYVPSGIRFLRSFNVKPNKIDVSDIAYIDPAFDQELSKSRLTAGTLVVVRTGTPGVAAVIPGELNGANCSDLVICRLVELLNPHYAAYYLNSDFAKNMVRNFQVGVAQQHFNVGAMSMLPLPFAPPNEQAEIVEHIEAAFKGIDRIADETDQAMNLLDRLKDATLNKAFRGELVEPVTSQPEMVMLR